MFPPASGAQAIAYGIAVIWGLVVAATIAVLSIGSFRRRRQTPDFYDARWQERYVPMAPRPSSSVQPFDGFAGDRARPALDARLRQMDALMVANRALVERLERAATPRLGAPAVGVVPHPAAIRPQPRPVPAPAARLRA